MLLPSLLFDIHMAMNGQVIIGFTIVLIALGVIAFLVFWSCRTIERISRKNLHSAREILKELNSDQ